MTDEQGVSTGPVKGFGEPITPTPISTPGEAFDPLNIPEANTQIEPGEACQWVDGAIDKLLRRLLGNNTIDRAMLDNTVSYLKGTKGLLKTLQRPSIEQTIYSLHEDIAEGANQLTPPPNKIQLLDKDGQPATADDAVQFKETYE